MIEFTPYATRARDLGGRWSRLPPWARVIVFIFALPAIALAVLSIFGFLISMLVLLLLVTPVYALLRQMTGSGVVNERENVDGTSVPVGAVNEPPAAGPSPGVKRVDSTVVQ